MLQAAERRHRKRGRDKSVEAAAALEEASVPHSFAVSPLFGGCFSHLFTAASPQQIVAVLPHFPSWSWLPSHLRMADLPASASPELLDSLRYVCAQQFAPPLSPLAPVVFGSVRARCW